MQNNGFAFTSNPYRNYRRMVLWARRNLDVGKSVDWSGNITLTLQPDGRTVYCTRSEGHKQPNFWAKVVIAVIGHREGRKNVAERKAAMTYICRESKGHRFPIPG